MTKDTEFEKLTKNIDWNRALLTVIPLLQPFIIFGAWLTFSRMNLKASIVSKIIAIAEPIPTLDLNVPREVVLASLFDFTEDTLEVIGKVTDLFGSETLDNLKKGIVTVHDTPVGDVDIDVKKEGKKYYEELLNDIWNTLTVVTKGKTR